MIHPPRWRGAGTTNPRKVGEVGRTLKSMDIEWLSMHTIEDGQKNFGAGTRYDMYIVRKSNTPGFVTEIRDENGNIVHECIKGMDFIPNCKFGLVQDLMAKEDEERVNVLFSISKYQAIVQHEWMSKEKTKEFCYPCLYSIKDDGSLTFKWSKEDRGHFGIPKVIFQVWHAAGPPYADHEGQYGMTQHAAAIVDDPGNLDLIAKAMDSDGFREVMKSCQFTTEKWNRQIIERFRKDFWKEFV